MLFGILNWTDVHPRENRCFLLFTCWWKRCPGAAPITRHKLKGCHPACWQGRNRGGAVAVLSASRTSQATFPGMGFCRLWGPKGARWGSRGEISYRRLFGWKQRDLASSQLMLRAALVLFAGFLAGFLPGVGWWGCPVPLQRDPWSLLSLWLGVKYLLDDNRVSLNLPCPWVLLLQLFTGQGRSFGF